MGAVAQKATNPASEPPCLIFYVHRLSTLQSILASLAFSGPVGGFAPIHCQSYQLLALSSSAANPPDLLVYDLAKRYSITITDYRSDLTTITYMAMAESDGNTMPGGECAATTLAELYPHGILIKYQLVFAYHTPYTKYSNPQGLSSSVDSSPVFNITMFPPNPSHLEHDRASSNDPDLSTGFYCYGDPESWAPLFPSSDDNELNNWAIIGSEQEFLAEMFEEMFGDDGFRMRDSDDDKSYIMKHPGGDAVRDDNGKKMLLIKFFAGPSPDQTEELSIFHFKRIVDGQSTFLTDREQQRLRRYLAGDFDGEDEESEQGGKGKEEEDKDPQHTGYPHKAMKMLGIKIV